MANYYLAVAPSTDVLSWDTTALPSASSNKLYVDAAVDAPAWQSSAPFPSQSQLEYDTVLGLRWV